MVSFLWENLFRKAEQKRDVVHILKSNPLFASLSTRELTFVKDLVHLRSFKPSEPIFRQGEVGVGMYMIVEGIVDIFVEDPDSVDRERQAVLVTRLTEGDFFGELSLVEENGKRTATAIAAEETSVYGFYKPDLLEVIERNPSTGVKVVQKLSEVLGRRLKETTSKVSDLKRELRRLSESTGRP